PARGGDGALLKEVCSARQGGVGLSVGRGGATADGRKSLDDGIRATDCECALDILFRIVMLCQIIDDVLDYSQDLSAGLPSFLTALGPLPQAFEAARLSARDYAEGRDLPRTGALVPLRLALSLVSIGTQL